METQHLDSRAGERRRVDRRKKQVPVAPNGDRRVGNRRGAGDAAKSEP
jgi:hypothetical protein